MLTLKPNGSLGFHANFGLISAISNCKQKKKAYANREDLIFLQGFQCLFTRTTSEEDMCVLYMKLFGWYNNEYADTVDRVAHSDSLLARLWKNVFFCKTHKKKGECIRKYAN